MLLWSGSCAAEPPADDILRAAYCVGVVNETIWQDESDAATIVPSQWAARCSHADPQVWSINECVLAMSKFADRTRQTLPQSWHSRSDRYWARLKSVPAEQARSLFHAYDNGKWDALDKMSVKSMAAKSVTKCFENCLLASAQGASCIVECVAQDDQVHANVLRCQLMPDPF